MHHKLLLILGFAQARQLLYNLTFLLMQTEIPAVYLCFCY